MSIDSHRFCCYTTAKRRKYQSFFFFDRFRLERSAHLQYYPLYRYPLFQRKGCGEFDCPVLDKWWDGSFSFPWWCGMDDAVIDTLCSSLISAVEELRG